MAVRWHRGGKSLHVISPQGNVRRVIQKSIALTNICNISIVQNWWCHQASNLVPQFILEVNDWLITRFSELDGTQNKYVRFTKNNYINSVIQKSIAQTNICNISIGRMMMSLSTQPSLLEVNYWLITRFSKIDWTHKALLSRFLWTLASKGTHKKSVKCSTRSGWMISARTARRFAAVMTNTKVLQQQLNYLAPSARILPRRWAYRERAVEWWFGGG